jgi:2-polyprenyl-3-methyl-5-hydroxy-6-metoxy-1,4-benzoquinol methylase
MKSDNRDITNNSLNYFSHTRHEIINLVPDGPNRILDVGCGTGNTLMKLKELGRAKEIVGVDLRKFDAKLDNFIVGNVELLELPYPREYFDVLICSDILEHLLNPWGTLKKLVCHLKTGGYLVSSIPNIREVRSLYKLIIGGSFEYEEAGVFDKTHLRFFCKKNIIDLLDYADLKIDSFHWHFSAQRKLLNMLTLGLLKDFLIVQYLVRARK